MTGNDARAGSIRRGPCSPFGTSTLTATEAVDQPRTE